MIKNYSERLKELGIIEYYVHSTRFKKRIMGQYEDMFEETHGSDVLLAFRGDLADIISSATHTDYDDEGMIIAETCKIHYKQAVLSIGQLIRYNTLKRTRTFSTSMYHTKDREPPLVIYLSELIHSQTRSMELVEQIAHLGLGISKERLDQMSISLGNAAIDTFQRDGVVVPVSLQKGLFCSSAIDNIGVNPKSSTAKKSLHGTAASINQHRIVDSGIKRNPVPLDTSCTKLKQLPDEYTDIFPFHLPAIIVPPKTNVTAMEETPSKWELLADNEWLENDELSWAAYHSESRSDHSDDIR